MWPFKRKALTGTPAVLDALNNGWEALPQLGGGSRQRIVEAFQTAKTANYAWMYRRSPAVRTVIDVITRNVAQLDLRLYEEIDESERQPRPDHPAAMSLRYPSETVTSDQFTRSLFKDKLLADDAVAIMQPTAAGQLVFKWVPISWVQFLGSSAFDTDVYRIHNPGNGIWTDFPADQILHWRGENPMDPRIGLSHLETLRDVVAEDAALQQASVELAQSGMVEPTWVFRPLEAPQWSNQARQGFEEDLTNRVAKANKRPVVLEEGMEMRSYGVTPKDAQMMEIRQWALGQVAAEYGVPGPMVGLTGDPVQAQTSFYTDTLPPYCEDYTRMLNQRILVRVYNETTYCFEFQLDEKHMGDDRIKSLVSGSGRAVYTTNEARAKLNLPPVDGGDDLVTPLNVVVGDNPKPSPQLMGPQDPNKPAQDGSYRTDGETLPPPPGKAIQKADGRIPQFHPGRKGDLDRQLRNIDLAQALLERHYNRLEKSMRSKAATDWGRWNQKLADDINRYANDVVEKEGTIYAFKFGGLFDMNRTPHYLRQLSIGAAEGINGAIKSDIEAYGVDGAFNQRDTHVQSAGAGLGASVTQFARREAAEQSPGTRHRVKTWVPDTDRHAEFGGDTVPLGADWPAGFAPGTVPGCRCTMAID